MSICSSLLYLATPLLTFSLPFPLSQPTNDPSMLSQTQQSRTFWYLCYDITHYLFIHSSLHLNCHPDNSDDEMNDNFSPINCNGASDAMRESSSPYYHHRNNVHRLHRSGRIKRRPAGRISSATHWIILKIGDDYYRATTSTSLSLSFYIHCIHSRFCDATHFTAFRGTCNSFRWLTICLCVFPFIGRTKPTPTTASTIQIT